MMVMTTLEAMAAVFVDAEGNKIAINILAFKVELKDT